MLVCARMCVGACIHMPLSEFVCMCVAAVKVCLGVWAFVCLCLCVFVFVCVFLRECVCVFLCAVGALGPRAVCLSFCRALVCLFVHARVGLSCSARQSSC